MKLSEDVQRKVIWEALEKFDGDRAKAAEELGMSLRTLYRHIDRLDMHGKIELMGWSRPGPPRGPRAGGLTALRIMLLQLIKAVPAGQRPDYGAMAIEIYGEDTPGTRQRIYTALDAIKRAGHLEFAPDGAWRVVTPKKKTA